jgi:hypothetical protein
LSSDWRFFWASIGLGGLGLGRIAAWLSIGAMIIYFASGLLRLSPPGIRQADEREDGKRIR